MNIKREKTRISNENDNMSLKVRIMIATIETINVIMRMKKMMKNRDQTDI